MIKNYGHNTSSKSITTLPIEIYSDQRKAEFLLSNAVTDQDYQAARKIVIKMGFNPENILHYRN